MALSVVLNALLILAGETAKWNPQATHPVLGLLATGVLEGTFRGF